MDAKELKKLYLDFFVNKGHKIIPSASLIPQNDPTTLFVSAGMHPLVPYLLGQPHPLGQRLVNVQKCVRTGDIEEVGDTFHHTFFEMLGNWSLGDYFKKDMISWSFEFLTKKLGYKSDHIHVTCFAGDKDAKKDQPSADIWQSLGIKPNHIHFLGKTDNWWGPAGATGPCGPDTEMFVDIDPQKPQVDFQAGCKSGRYIEIWNDVFMEYNKSADGKFKKLDSKNVDTGFGVERNLAVLLGFDDDYLTPIWQPIIKEIEKLSGKIYQDYKKPFRIITDHIRAAVFIINDGVEPSNKQAGYVLRRLIRRSIVQAQDLGIKNNFVTDLAQAVIKNKKNYADDYDFDTKIIKAVLKQEEDKFRKTLNRGLKQIEKLIKNKKTITGQDAFNLYQSFGFPFELIKEKLDVNEKEFKAALEKHQKLSRTLSAGKFKSGLADHSQVSKIYHTATHLLHAALRQVLGTHVQQAGSNINPNRLRFDFSHSQALTDQQIKAVEKLVNQKIKQSLPVKKQDMKLDLALKSGALAFFGAKYPDVVSVYSVADFSKELCTGPHLKNTSELGHFKITKHLSIGAGKRRLYAVCQ